MFRICSGKFIGVSIVWCYHWDSEYFIDLSYGGQLPKVKALTMKGLPVK